MSPFIFILFSILNFISADYSDLTRVLKSVKRKNQLVTTITTALIVQ
jgi:hypothetical protein